MLVERALDAFLADVVAAGEPEHLCHHLAAWVVAAILDADVHARDLEMLDPGRQIGGDLPAQIGEVALGGIDPSGQLARGHLEDLRQIVELLRRGVELLGDRRDRSRRRADGQRLAVAIEDPAAIGRHVDDAAVARRAFLLQELVGERLQIDGPAQHHHEPRTQHAEHDARAPGWLACDTTGAGARESHCLVAGAPC